MEQDHLSQISQLLEEAYNVFGSVVRLAGENENYLITTADGGRRFVLKVAEGQESIPLIELEHRAVEASASSCDLVLPRLVKTVTGNIYVASRIDSHSPPLVARLLHYVEGSAWFEDTPVSLERCCDLGRQIARLDQAMSVLDPATANHTHPWDLACAGQHRKNIYVIEDTAQRLLADRAFQVWGACANFYSESLPHSVIHGDLNDDNLRVVDGKLHGVIDFGDCLYNPTIGNLAIALAYLLLEQEDPLEIGAEFVAAYHGVRPLSRTEVEVLFPLMCGRLATSVVISAQRKRVDPDRSAWYVSEDRAWRALAIYAEMSPVEAARRLAAKTDIMVYEEVGLSKKRLFSLRKKHFSTAMSLSYDEPLKFIRGRGQYLFDENGEPHLDLYNNVCHVGHCHPRVVEAASRQMATLNTNTRYLYDNLYEYSERLCSTLPASLSQCFFVNSGSEANELALRLARTHTEATDLVVVDNAYHGHTSTLVGVSPYKFMGKGGSGRPGKGVHVAPIPDGYRGPYKGQGHDSGVAYGKEVGVVLEEKPGQVAAFIAESLLSCGGQIIPPDGYLQEVFRHVHQAGGVCILDEVQVGFGRTGTHFWAFETQGVVPDIVVMGKPMGNGHPLAAVITTEEISRSFGNRGMEFFATYGGNPVSCAAGLAVLDVIADEHLQENARLMGDCMLAGLRELQQRHTIVGDVRGVGMFIGIELVRDRATLDPATTEARAVVNALRRHRILTGTDGPFDNVIKIKPPMVINRDDVAHTIECFDKILTEF